MEETRPCRRCKQTLPKSSFTQANWKAGRKICSPCHTAENKERRLAAKAKEPLKKNPKNKVWEWPVTPEIMKPEYWRAT